MVAGGFPGKSQGQPSRDEGSHEGKVEMRTDWRVVQSSEVRTGHGRALHASGKRPCQLQREVCPDGNGWRLERDPESTMSLGP